MASAPIVLVPGFWLGAWAWDEVADALRADGHDVTALTLPGLESADADRSAVTMVDHVDAITAAVQAAGAPVVLAVHSGTGFPGYTASDRDPRADRSHGLRRLRAWDRRDESRLRRRRDAPTLAGGACGGGEPRRAQRRAARDLSATGRAATGWSPARGGRADERRAPRDPEHDHLHGVPVRAGEGLRRGAQPGLARRPRRAQRRHLDRPADEPLADVVTPGRARRHHRRRREGSRLRRLER